MFCRITPEELHKYETLLAKCKENHAPIMVNNDGKDELVVMDKETFYRREKMLELREKLLESEEARLHNEKADYTLDEFLEYVDSEIEE